MYIIQEAHGQYRNMFVAKNKTEALYLIQTEVLPTLEDNDLSAEEFLEKTLQQDNFNCLEWQIIII